MKTLLLLLTLLTCVWSAEMPHCTIELEGGAQFTGWWAADQGVVYCDDGSRKWINDLKKVKKTMAVKTDEKEPKKVQFKRLPDLPYVAVTEFEKGKAVETTVGWFDEEARIMWPSPLSDGSIPFSRSFLADRVLAIEKAAKPNIETPAIVREYLDRKSIEGLPK